MITTVEPSIASEKEAPGGEAEPSRTCTDITIGDDRWMSVAGLQELIPNLAVEAFREIGLAPETHCVSVALLSDAEVRTLNKVFRGKDEATNVLSFPTAFPVGERRSHEPLFIGDVALAYETVINEASAQGKTALQHAAHLLAHGVLHLAGFDHADDADAERMEAAELAILAKFGIPDPYRDDPLQSTSL